MGIARKAGIGVGLALLLGAESASAIVIMYEFRLVSSSPVPGNGVLVFERTFEFAGDPNPAVTVQGPSGSVAGELTTVSGFLVWHPNGELPVGEYTVEVTCPNRGDCIETGPVAFQVTEPQLLEPPSATCSLTLAPTTTYGEQKLCCGLLPERTALWTYCFPTALRSNQVGLRAWTCHVDLAGAEAEQILFKMEETPREDPAPSASNPPPLYVSPFDWWSPPVPVDATGIMEVQAEPPRRLAEAPEYCVEIELMDTRTGETTRARRCEPDPGWEPVEVPIEDLEARLLGLPDCEVPPAGLEERWCELNRAYHDDRCTAQEPPADPVDPLCTAYREACVQDPPVPPPPDDAPGCACRLAAPPGRDGAGSRVGLLALLGLGVLGVRRHDHGAPRRTRGAARRRQ